MFLDIQGVKLLFSPTKTSYSNYVYTKKLYEENLQQSKLYKYIQNSFSDGDQVKLGSINNINIIIFLHKDIFKYWTFLFISLLLHFWVWI